MSTVEDGPPAAHASWTLRSEPVVCPDCGARQEVPPFVERKIERRLRSGRCPRCMGYGPVPVKARGLSHCDFEEYPPWWLERHSDEEIAEPARAFGVDDASASNVAAWRERLLTPVKVP